MAWLTLDNKRKIMRVIAHLISKGIEIRIRLKGEKTIFASRFINIGHGRISLERGPELIIEKLFPEKGNSLIQSLPEVAVEFSINQNLCRRSLKYLGISSTPPHFGFILGFPESLEIEEKRREERFAYEQPGFISVEFRLGKEPKRDRLYQLNVLHCSKHGLGLLITKKDFDLLRILHKGDRLEDIAFFASWAMVKVSGTVSHIMKIEDGKYKGCYHLGIHSPDIIEGYKPNSH
jgi:hypothetical protein